jgi:hypothetical protein
VSFYDRLSPAELRETARQLVPRLERARHWSRVAEAVGRVQDAGLAEAFGFPTAAEWAASELGMPRSEFVQLQGLWDLMKRVPVVAPEVWLTISRSNARELRRILSDGRGLTDTLLALATGPYAPLRAHVEQALGREAWTRFGVAMPVGLAETVHAAMTRAARVVLDDPTVEAPRALDRDVAFRALEVICAEYLAGDHGAA